MSQRLNDFLAQEASEYLAQMESLLRGAAAVDPEQLLRLARGVRGSAQMAGAAPITAVAERLEQGVRSVAEGRARWGEELRTVVLHTVRDLQLLLRGLGRWGEEEQSRAEAALRRWEPPVAPGATLAPSPAPARAPTASEPDIVPISELLLDEPEPAPAAAPVPVVAIGTLLLRGDDALREALALRPRLQELVARAAPGEPAGALLDELFDLIRLGRPGDAPPPA